MPITISKAVWAQVGHELLVVIIDSDNMLYTYHFKGCMEFKEESNKNVKYLQSVPETYYCIPVVTE